jgi:tetratricopeptide (TPR) repeat protein
MRLMRADVLVNSLVEENNIEARRLLHEAVQIDPACAAAWGELADSYIGDYMMGHRGMSMAGYLDQAFQTAQTALDNEPEFTHALNVISLVQAFRGDFAQAIKTSRKALAAAPRNPEIVANCAYALALCGLAEEAHQTIRRAIDATPIPPMWYLTVDGLCHYLRGQPQAAIAILRKAVDLVPESAFARPYLVGALTDAGDHDEAAAVARDILRVQPDFTLATWPGADVADQRVRDRLIASLKKAGITA